MLADSSVVTLALPEILARFETTVVGVSWVLTAFNIVLALAVLPAAAVGDPRGRGARARVWGGGLAGSRRFAAVCGRTHDRRADRRPRVCRRSAAPA